MVINKSEKYPKKTTTETTTKEPFFYSIVLFTDGNVGYNVQSRRRREVKSSAFWTLCDNQKGNRCIQGNNFFPLQSEKLQFCIQEPDLAILAINDRKSLTSAIYSKKKVVPAYAHRKVFGCINFYHSAHGCSDSSNRVALPAS